MFNGRRQPSRDGTSRMTREYQVRFCERLGVKFPGPTRQFPPLPRRKHRRLLLLNQQTFHVADGHAFVHRTRASRAIGWPELSADAIWLTDKTP